MKNNLIWKVVDSVTGSSWICVTKRQFDWRTRQLRLANVWYTVTRVPRGGKKKQAVSAKPEKAKPEQLTMF